MLMHTIFLKYSEVYHFCKIIKQQGMVTRGTLATSTTSYSFTFTLQGNILNATTLVFFYYFICSQGTHRVIACKFFKSN